MHKQTFALAHTQQLLSARVFRETKNRKNHSPAPWLPQEFVLLWQCGNHQHGSKTSLIKAASTATRVISDNHKTVMHYHYRWKLKCLIVMMEVFH